ncbi:MAG: endonuclease/exonuclease/phosphatase family protein [Candidatus Hydrogenedentes bacterium]|nr:endonuclease/exonuclease/phosphatase family protein [Candidatus Hydrogenedentota bacterium]
MPRLLKIALLVLCLIAAAPLVLLCGAALFNGRTGAPTDFAESAALREPPPAAPAPVTLRVVTFNIQDLYLRSQDRPRRMKAIAAKLYTLDPDIVGFQEAFIAADREILMRELAPSRLKYFEYYPSGTVGSGLLIASAFPIQEAWFHRFTASNPFYKVWEGDWWAGKGVALARIALPEGGLIDFYNTHAQAGYGNPAYDAVRAQQMRELADFMNASRCPTAPALLAGDMNCRPGDPEFEIAVSGAGLARVMIGESRIDHLFAAESDAYTVEVESTEPIEAAVRLGDTVLELSDHTGYMSTLIIRPRGEAADAVAPGAG